MKNWKGDKWSKYWFYWLVFCLIVDLIGVVNAIITEDKASLIFDIIITLIMVAAVWLDWKTYHD